MTTIEISDFSCLKKASLTLQPVIVIIGPQGSGKSVTTKLLYFCSDILNSFMQFAEKGDRIEDFRKHLCRQFSVWFPPSAWGQERFIISYSSGPFSVRFLRRRSGGVLGDEISLTFSKWFTEAYRETLSFFERTRTGAELDSDQDLQVTGTLDRLWRDRDLISRRISKEMSGNYISSQTFIPAGRAFFTTIGRLVAGIEQAGSLDPVTINFARLFASIRDRSARRLVYRPERLGDEFIERRAKFMDQLFGGKIQFKDDKGFVESNDGRLIPFQSLSSGQQELLPMWSLLDYMTERDALRLSNGIRTTRLNQEIVYIEEPEAHLFPSAQSLLMDFLIGAVASQRNKRNLILTTHSPYIMSKLNVFIKAGQLGRRRARSEEVNEIVPRSCWLSSTNFSAYKIEEGILESLYDEDGLIDGTYLDSVSESISIEFSRLLQIEASS